MKRTKIDKKDFKDYLKQMNKKEPVSFLLNWILINFLNQLKKFLLKISTQRKSS